MIDTNRTPQVPPEILPVPEGTVRPLWSVMIPTYNCTTYLSKTLSLVLEQDLGPELMQIEVIDDCSTDGDVEQLVKDIGKGRVLFYRQPRNVGSLRNFETCINRAKGERVHILHGDDFVLAGFYNEIDLLFKECPDAGAAFTSFKYINSEDLDLWPGKKLAQKRGILKDVFDLLILGQILQPPSIVVKRSVYEDLGSFFAVHYGEDWLMWVRIAAKYKMAYSPAHLARYRLHTNNITTRSLISGANIEDTLKVIDIIQQFVPEEKRESMKRRSMKNYSLYFAKISDSLYNLSPDAALRQVEESKKLSLNFFTVYHWFKILFKRAIRYKMT